MSKIIKTKREKLYSVVLTSILPLLFISIFSSIILIATAQIDGVEEYATNTEEPDAEFSADLTSGYAPLTVKFTDESTGNPTEWKWNFGDGSDIIDGFTSAYKNPTHTYEEAGVYEVKETAINSAGRNTEIKSHYITVKSPEVIDDSDDSGFQTSEEEPNAEFSADITSGYAPLTVKFTDESTGNPTEWKWNFGDGSDIIDGSTLAYKNPTHTYEEAGVYEVKETAINSAGRNTEIKSHYITVKSPEEIDDSDDSGLIKDILHALLGDDDPDDSEPQTSENAPVANFSASNSENESLTVKFTDESTGSPTSWHWDFGDGETSDQQNPTHTYSLPETYTVNLTTSNVNGTNFKLATINVLEKPVLPVANFSSNVSSGYVPLVVQFNDSSKNATGWNWDFGDGSTSIEQNPMHTYSGVGNYTVNLKVINGNGTDSILGTVIVFAKPEPVLPVANFSANITEGYEPLDVQFNDSSENTTGWNWDFGDGSTSIEQNPMHTYSGVGNYTVNLEAKNGNGTNSITAPIDVDNPALTVLPVANFSSNVTNGVVPFIVQFTDLSTNATTWNWNFGNGETSDQQNPTHKYSEAGNYIVSLTVRKGEIDTDIDISTKTQTINATYIDTNPPASYPENKTPSTEKGGDPDETSTKKASPTQAPAITNMNINTNNTNNRYNTNVNYTNITTNSNSNNNNNIVTNSDNNNNIVTNSDNNNGNNIHYFRNSNNNIDSNNNINNNSNSNINNNNNNNDNSEDNISNSINNSNNETHQNTGPSDHIDAIIGALATIISAIIGVIYFSKNHK